MAVVHDFKQESIRMAAEHLVEGAESALRQGLQLIEIDDCLFVVESLLPPKGVSREEHIRNLAEAISPVFELEDAQEELEELLTEPPEAKKDPRGDWGETLLATAIILLTVIGASTVFRWMGMLV